MTTLFVICLILLLMSFLWPFVGGYREIKRDLDALPLFIDMSYQKNPRYFALSFKKIFRKNVATKDGIHNVKISREETAEVRQIAFIKEKTVIPYVYYVKSNMASGRDVFFKKEVYVKGSARLGQDNQLRAIACDEDIEVSKGTKLYRWLDAEGNVEVGEDCDLGVSATCAGRLSVAHKCSFQRLYGHPVVVETGGEAAAQGYLADAGIVLNVVEDKIERDISQIPRDSVKHSSIITNKKLIIEDNVIIYGHVKVNEQLIIGANAQIAGNIFAEGDIRIGTGSHIGGTVFSQGDVILEKGVTVGSRGRIKSVVAKKSVSLHDGVKVYGLVNTERGWVAV